MKLDKLPSAIRRELMASPKKAVLLALLLAAAAYFWGPIVWRKMVGSSAAPAAATPVAQVAAKPRLDEPQRLGASKGGPATNWRAILAARQRDALTQSAAFDPSWPQPFRVEAQVQGAQGQPGADGSARASVLLTPTEAGLVLESIVYGKTRRAAVISGEIYHEGSEVVVATPQGPPVTFQLIQIEPRSVALERYGKRFSLEFPKPKLPPANRSDAGHKRSLPSQQDRP